MRLLAGATLALLLLLALFAAGAGIGALVPAPVAGVSQAEGAAAGKVTVFLLSGPLHVDIAVPASAEVVARFAFLRGTGVPLDHPDLRYLSFGWGASGFYTTAGTYADIRLGVAARAIAGDSAVMRVTATGPLAPSPDATPLALSPARFALLLEAIESGFASGPDGGPVHLAGVSLSPGDAFFEARGRFDILQPCNQWTNRTLRAAGVPLGAWTPTVASLRLSLRWFDPDRL